MKKWILAVVALAIIAAVYLSSQQGNSLRVTASPVQRGDVIASVSNTRAGTVDACRRAGIAPTIGGSITHLYVVDGQKVSEGELLLELWNDDLQAQVTLAEREAAAAASRSEQACVTARVSKRAADRLVRLHETDIASEDAVEKAVGEAESAAAACAASRDSAKVKVAAVEAAEAALRRTQLRAPFAGVIAEINGELGEFVTPSPVGIPTPPTVDLIDTSCLFIRAPLDEVDAPRVAVGLKAWITLDAFKERKFSGKVQRVAPYVLDLEKQSRTVDVEAVIDDDHMELLLPGYSADVEVIQDQREDVLLVPTATVMEDSTVFVIPAGGGVIEQRQVETGIANWEQTEVLSGLQEGEWVVRSLDRVGVEHGANAVVE